MEPTTSTSTTNANNTFQDIVEQEKQYLEKVYPTPDDIPTCFQHFDRIIMCGGVKAQIKSIYRYGHRPVCDWHIEDFKHCLSMKLLSKDKRRDVWIQRRAEWWATRRLAKSSEDVWEMRSPEEMQPGWPIPLSKQFPDMFPEPSNSTTHEKSKS